MNDELISGFHAVNFDSAMSLYAASRQSAEIYAMEIHDSIYFANDSSFSLQVKLWIGKNYIGERSLTYRQQFENPQPQIRDGRSYQVAVSFSVMKKGKLVTKSYGPFHFVASVKPVRVTFFNEKGRLRVVHNTPTGNKEWLSPDAPLPLA
jgi:hypothetical protein